MKYSLIIILALILCGCTIGPSQKVFTIGDTVYISSLHTTGKLLNLTTTQSGRFTTTMAQVEIEFIDSDTKMKKTRVDNFSIEYVYKYPLEKE